MEAVREHARRMNARVQSMPHAQQGGNRQAEPEEVDQVVMIWHWRHHPFSHIRPFDKPTSGHIAVKVINHLGDEVMKVFKVP